MSTEFKAFPYPGFDRDELMGFGVGKTALTTLYHPQWTAPIKVKRRRKYVSSHELPYIFQPRPKFNRTHELAEDCQCSMRDILAAVALASCINIEHLKSHRRFQPLVQARFVFFWLARLYTGHSFPEIGRFLNMDHSTVMYGFARVEFSHNDYRELVEDAKSALAERLEGKG